MVVQTFAQTEEDAKYMYVQLKEYIQQLDANLVHNSHYEHPSHNTASLYKNLSLHNESLLFNNLEDTKLLTLISGHHGWNNENLTDKDGHIINIINHITIVDKSINTTNQTINNTNNGNIHNSNVSNTNNDISTHDLLVKLINEYVANDKHDEVANILRLSKSEKKLKDERLAKEKLVNDTMEWINNNRPTKNEITSLYHDRYSGNSDISKPVCIATFNVLVKEKLDYKIIRSTDTKYHWSPRKKSSTR
jgi:hypothetical protein